MKESKIEKVDKGENIISQAEGLKDLFKEGYFSSEDINIVTKYLKGGVSFEEFKEFSLDKIEKEEKEEKMVEEALKRLENLGILEQRDDFSIMDIDQFISLIYKGSVTKLGPIYNNTEYNSWMALYRIFRDKEIVSKKDWEKNNKVTKPLFYFPKEEEDFDIEKIKKSDFHLSPFEYSKINLNQKIPFSDNKATLLEASMASLIYHPRFGDGYKDKYGQIFVRDKESREYKKISYSFFIDYKLRGGSPNKYGDSIDTLRPFIRQKLSFLVEKDLISPSNFGVRSGSQAAEHERMEKQGLSPDGVVMINRVKHYLGKSFKKELGDEKIRIIQLDDSLGGIIVNNQEGEEELKYVFNILLPSSELKSFKDGYFWAEKEKTNPRPYNPKENFPRRADENLEDYQKRINNLENFNSLLKFSQKLVDETGIQFFNYPFEYQKILIHNFEILKEKEKEVIDFIKRYKENGLLAFLSTEYGEEHGEKVLKIAEILPERELKSVFAEYSNILELASSFESIFKESILLKESNLSQHIKERLPININEGILRRAKDLLIASYPLFVEKKKSDIEIQDIILSLKGLRKFLEIMRDFQKNKIEHEINFVNKKSHYGLDNFLYRVKDHNDKEYMLKIGIRPEELENAQARISFELNFNTDKPNEELKKAFSQSIFYKNENKEKKSSRLRIAIDREVVGEKEIISLDMGRDKREDKDFKRTGDVLGKTLTFVSETGHHNPDSFDPQYAQKDIFSEIAKTFNQYLRERDKILL